MIPNNITRESILKAISDINLNEIPSERNSTKFVLRYNDVDYPPKYIISIANKYVNDAELSANEFSGGKEANGFLKKLGFTILEMNDINSYIVESFSWKVLNQNIAAKEVDKSVFLHHGTGLPKDIRFFFNVKDMGAGERREIILAYKDIDYSAHIETDKLKSPRSRLLWKADFSGLIKNELNDWYRIFKENNVTGNKIIPNIYLKKQQHDDNRFIVEFIDPNIIYTDIRIDDDNNEATGKVEGKIKYYYGKRYERDIVNREKAIAIHGTKCCVCGFDFEKAYGERGKGYIEVHHITPLSTLDEEIIINPETDLIPVCSNCHKMIHRYKDKVLEIEELKKMLDIQKINKF